jgi:hypothetical protein
MKSSKGETVTYIKRFTGIVESVVERNTPNEKYIVRTQDGSSLVIYPKDIIDSGIALRKQKATKPKVKKLCGCS